MKRTLQKSTKSLQERLQAIKDGTRQEAESQFIEDCVNMARGSNENNSAEAGAILAEFVVFAHARWIAQTQAMTGFIQGLTF